MKRDLYAEVSTRILAEFGAWGSAVGQALVSNTRPERPAECRGRTALFGLQCDLGCGSHAIAAGQLQGFSRSSRQSRRVETCGRASTERRIYFVKQYRFKDGDGEETETRLVPMLREYTVFNVDQCENLPDGIKTGKPMRVRNPDTRECTRRRFLVLNCATFARAMVKRTMCRATDFISMPAFAALQGAIISTT